MDGEWAAASLILPRPNRIQLSYFSSSTDLAKDETMPRLKSTENEKEHPLHPGILDQRQDKNNSVYTTSD